jgi:hypothetical protein
MPRPSPLAIAAVAAQRRQRRVPAVIDLLPSVCRRKGG